MKSLQELQTLDEPFIDADADAISLITVATPAGEEMVDETDLSRDTGVFSIAKLQELQDASHPHRHATPMAFPAVRPQ